MTRFITFILTFEGIHHWAEAPERVDFLRHPHRHTFFVEGKLEVGHANRETEFICLKHDVLAFIEKRWPFKDNVAALGQWSCEMIAEEIFKEFNLQECFVFEDKENGGGVSK